jgi:multidrug transporter EmrE-like cation transporter
MSAGRSRVFLVMGASALLAAGSNLVLRHGMGGLGGAGEAGALAMMAAALTSPLVLVGLAGYAVSQLLWLNVLAAARLGAAFPIFVSSTFVMVMAGSILVLGEQLTVNRLGGAALVAAGIVVAEWTRGAGEAERREERAS